MCCNGFLCYVHILADLQRPAGESSLRAEENNREVNAVAFGEDEYHTRGSGLLRQYIFYDASSESAVLEALPYGSEVRTKGISLHIGTHRSLNSGTSFFFLLSRLALLLSPLQS